LQADHKGKNIIKKNTKMMIDGKVIRAKNTLLRTKNKPRKYNHTGIMGFSSNLGQKNI